MVQFVFECLIDIVLQGVGWAVMKVISFGRYRGFQPGDIWLEGTVGFVTLAACGYGAYWLWT